MRKTIFQAEVANIRLEEYALKDGRHRLIVTMGTVVPKRRRKR